MIEVLVALVLVLIGLLGLAGLQSRAQVAENESYQRVQALVLLRDMVDRVNANRSNAASYITGISASENRGKGYAGCNTTSPRAAADLCEWDQACKGTGESIGTCDLAGNNCVGAMIGARGCITSPAANQYLIQVAWQGLGQTSSPPVSLACGKDQYGNGTASCCQYARRNRHPRLAKI